MPSQLGRANVPRSRESVASAAARCAPGGAAVRQVRTGLERRRLPCLRVRVAPARFAHELRTPEPRLHTPCRLAMPTYASAARIPDGVSTSRRQRERAASCAGGTPRGSHASAFRNPDGAGSSYATGWNCTESADLAPGSTAPALWRAGPTLRASARCTLTPSGGSKRKVSSPGSRLNSRSWNEPRSLRFPSRSTMRVSRTSPFTGSTVRKSRS